MLFLYTLSPLVFILPRWYIGINLISNSKISIHLSALTGGWLNNKCHCFMLLMYLYLVLEYGVALLLSRVEQLLYYINKVI